MSKTTNMVVFLAVMLAILTVAPVFGRGAQEDEAAEVVHVEGEPPRFGAAVASGELPPLSERLPLEPLVIEPHDTIGRHGGIANVPPAGPGDPTPPWTFIMGEGLLRWDVTLSELRPNVAKAWEMSDDGRTFTFFLREGMRWSDGAPFTANDIGFWWDIAMDERVYPNGFPDTRAFFQGGWMDVNVVDDYTVQFIFPQPNPLFPNHLGHQRGWYPVLIPRHYIEQFHPDYASAADIEARLAEYSQFNDYQEYLSSVALGPWYGIGDDNDINRPTLNAFNVTHKGATTMLFEANPYYWKVDPAGNQLPYIDGIRSESYSDGTVLESKIITGEVDYFSGWVTSLETLPTYRQYEDRGNYRVIFFNSTEQSQAIAFNLAHKDEGWREVVQDARFRQAMSLAIDREEISETFYFGLAEPFQATVHSTSSVYDPQYSSAYAEYDPDRANALLDEMGLDRRDGDGYRLRPDGQRMRILAEFPSDWQIARFELIEEYWEDVGIQVEIRPISGELLGQRVEANEAQIIGPGGIDRSVDSLFFTDAHWFAPNVGMRERGDGWPVVAANAWDLLPAEIHRLADLREEMEQTLDENRRRELAREIVESQAENLWRISIRGTAPKEVFARTTLRNIPEDAFWGFDGFWSYSHNVEQFFFDD